MIFHKNLNIYKYMFDEYSSEDEDCNPYTFDKCKYGHYISAGGFCCYACKKEYSDKQSDEYMKNLFQQFLKEHFDLDFDINVDNHLSPLPYEILGINIKLFNRLTTHQKIKRIKKQYKRYSLKYHPDKGGSNEKFIQVKDAYDLLLSEVY
tara:strand:- start:213 stop:662 length:450 start_codon:yes stop_codon:yes gene_type:complete